MIMFSNWVAELKDILATHDINLVKEQDMNIEVFDEMGAPRTDGTSLKGYVIAAYQDLLNVLGKPTFDEPSGDNKVQAEWVVGFDEKIYTIYDWKQYDSSPTDNPLTPIRWHVGGYENADDFIDALEKELGV
jgi:hypothetical protein